MKYFRSRLTLLVLAVIQFASLFVIARIIALTPPDVTREDLADPYMGAWAIALLVSIIFAIVYAVLLIRKKASLDWWIVGLLLLSVVSWIVFGNTPLYEGP